MTKHMQTKRNIDAALLLVQEKMDIHLAATNNPKKAKPVPKKTKTTLRGPTPAPDPAADDIFSAKTDSLLSDEEASNLFSHPPKPDPLDEIENFVKRNFVLQSEQKDSETIKRYISQHAPPNKNSTKETIVTVGKIGHKNFGSFQPSSLEKKIAFDSPLEKADENYPAPAELSDSQYSGRNNGKSDPENHQAIEEQDDLEEDR